MNIKNNRRKLSEVILNVFQLKDITLEVQENKTEFEGDFTIVTFPLVKQLKKKSGKYRRRIGRSFNRKDRFTGKF
jgi:arginyl-tRNA synthetase